MLDRAVEIDSVSKRHCGRDQRQPRRAMPLVLDRGVALFAQTIGIELNVRARCALRPC